MKNIGKIKAAIIGSVVALVLAFGLIFTFVPMQIGSKDFESVVGTMNLSQDIAEGISAEYTIDGEYSDEQISKAINLMAEISSEYGFKSVSIYKKGADKIRVDVNSTVLESEKSGAESFLTTLASGKIEFKSKNEASAKADPEAGVIVIDGSEHIKTIEKINYRTAAGLSIEFTKQGKELYSAATGSPLYMFVGGEAWPGSNNQNEIAANNDPSSTTMTLMFNSADVVDSYYYVLRAGMLPISLDADSVQIVYMSSSSATLARVITFVLALVIIAGLAALLIVRFRGFGIASVAASAIALFVLLFLMQAMEWVVVGKATMIAIILMMITNYAVQTIIFNQIKEESKIGKSIETATEDGFRKTTKISLIIYGVMFVVGTILAFAIRGELQTIGTVLALGSALLALATLVLVKPLLTVLYSLSGKMAFFGLKEREDA